MEFNLDSLITFMRFQGIHRWISKFRHSGKLLDVGCGRGGLIQYLYHLGWQVFGIDPTSLSLNINDPFLRKHSLSCCIENLPFSEQSFDVVLFNFSLEHMENPIGNIKYAYKLLTSRGLVFIRVPNHDKIYIRRFWNSFQIRISSHRNFFNPHSLRILLESYGFRIIQMSTPLAINAAITIPCSLFYQLDPERWIYGKSRLSYLTKTILLGILSIIFLPITWIQCQFGQGAVIHAVAEKV